MGLLAKNSTEKSDETSWQIMKRKSTQELHDILGDFESELQQARTNAEFVLSKKYGNRATPDAELQMMKRHGAIVFDDTDLCIRVIPHGIIQWEEKKAALGELWDRRTYAKEKEMIDLEKTL